jgi:hypothetical protein
MCESNKSNQQKNILSMACATRVLPKNSNERSLVLEYRDKIFLPRVAELDKLTARYDETDGGWVEVPFEPNLNIEDGDKEQSRAALHKK